MEKTPPRRFRLIGTALVVLVILLALPATRWLVRSQLAMQIIPAEQQGWILHELGGQGAIERPSAVDAVLRETAARRPQDYRTQMAYATMALRADGTWKSQDAADRLAALTSRFPDEPSLYAHILRYNCFGSLLNARGAEQDLASDTIPSTPSATPNGAIAIRYATPERLAAMEAAAIQGERLEPNNAFFPYMRAIVLFSAHRDTEALTALERAGAATSYEDYSSDEAQSKLQLNSETFGSHTALADIATCAALLLPHYAQMRAGARLMTYKAIEAEQAGQAEQGVAIRHSLMHVGDLMRVHARTYIGTLVGIAIAAIPTSRPGGIPQVPATRDKAASNAERRGLERARARMQRYCAYLRGIGHADEAAWAQAEYDAGQRTKEVGSKGLELSAFNIPPILRLAGWWVADLLTLANILWLLTMGGVAALLMRYRLIRGKAPLVILFAAFGVCAGLLLWQTSTHGVVALYRAVVTLMGSTDGGGMDIVDRLKYLVVAASAVFPLLVALVCGVVSLICRVPLSTGLVRGFKGLALPISGTLFLLYAGLLLGTVREEARIDDGLTRMLQNEGRYLANLAGEPWPGPATSPEKR